jgi:DNA-directed RNA polymerase specialized sigma54-like protein
MIEEEDTCHPLTDEHITERVQAEGIQVTRRTVAKYREDMQFRPRIKDVGSQVDSEVLTP